MKVSDLLAKQLNPIYSSEVYDDEILTGDLIALDGKTGAILFDTSRNKEAHIAKFMNGKIIALWADAKRVESPFGDYFRPIMKCYLSYKSWE